MEVSQTGVWETGGREAKAHFFKREFGKQFVFCTLNEFLIFLTLKKYY